MVNALHFKHISYIGLTNSLFSGLWINYLNSQKLKIQVEKPSSVVGRNINVTCLTTKRLGFL